MAELPKDMIFHYHSDDGITIKVDAIPLVRCKDCKFYEKGHGCDLLDVFMINMDDWFCADGERRSND